MRRSEAAEVRRRQAARDERAPLAAVVEHRLHHEARVGGRRRRRQPARVGAQHVAAPHPQEPVVLGHGVTRRADTRRRRARRHVDARALGAEAPAVVKAAQDAVLHLAHRERRGAVRTHVAHADGLAVGVAVQHHRLAPQPGGKGLLAAELVRKAHCVPAVVEADLRGRFAERLCQSSRHPCLATHHRRRRCTHRPQDGRHCAAQRTARHRQK